MTEKMSLLLDQTNWSQEDNPGRVPQRTGPLLPPSIVHPPRPQQPRVTTPAAAMPTKSAWPAPEPPWPAPDPTAVAPGRPQPCTTAAATPAVVRPPPAPAVAHAEQPAVHAAPPAAERQRRRHRPRGTPADGSWRQGAAPRGAQAPSSSKGGAARQPHECSSDRSRAFRGSTRKQNGPHDAPPGEALRQGCSAGSESRQPLWLAEQAYG